MTALDASMIDFGTGAADHGISTAPREFTSPEDGRYVLRVAGLTFTIDRLRREWGALVGELAVACSWPEARTVDEQGTVSAADLKLSDQRARLDRARYLEKRIATEGVDFAGLLDEVCARVLHAERSGAPAVHLREVARPMPDDVFDVLGLHIPREHPSDFFGDGGSLKSYFALAVAGHITQAGRRVLYVDWECSAADHRARLESLYGPDMPDVLYVRAERPLTVEAERLRRIIRDERIDFGIFDSVGFGCDGPPESAEAALAYNRALRGLKIGSFNLAHITKGENGDQRPFGSTYWHNSARATWFIKRSQESPDGRSVTVAIFNRKVNHGPLRPAVGLEVTFAEGRTTITRVDLATVEEFAGQLPVWQRMVSALRAGALTPADLAREIDAKQDTVERKARAHPRLFTRFTGSDGITRIGLIEGGRS